MRATPCDRMGLALLRGEVSGSGAYTHMHDGVLRAKTAIAKASGVPCRQEPENTYADLLAQASPQDAADARAALKALGAVHDGVDYITAACPDELRTPSGKLMTELKTIQFGPTNYPSSASVTGVERRAANVVTEVTAALKKCDLRYYPGQTNQDGRGPFSQRLHDLGGIHGLVIGAIGEVNDTFHSLLGYYASERAVRQTDCARSLAGRTAAALEQARWRIAATRSRARHAQLAGRMKLMGLGASSVATGTVDLAAFNTPLAPRDAAVLAA